MIMTRTSFKRKNSNQKKNKMVAEEGINHVLLAILGPICLPLPPSPFFPQGATTLTASGNPSLSTAGPVAAQRRDERAFGKSRHLPVSALGVATRAEGREHLARCDDAVRVDARDALPVHAAARIRFSIWRPLPGARPGMKRTVL